MRYHLKLLGETPQEATIEVHPRWAVDARNWKFARVILKKSVYLPRAVQLIDPSGNLETVYTFGEFKINEDGRNFMQKFFGQDAANPFRPNLQAKGYVFKVANGAANAKQTAELEGLRMPSLSGSNWKSAKELMEKLECKVTFQPGQWAPQDELKHVVYHQQPAAKAPLRKGQNVVLTIYTPEGTAPELRGVFWKKAGQQLESKGYKVKYLRGKATTETEKLYIIYEQSPAAGQQVKPGSEITLTVYTKAE
ncbi:MAG: PASTA domain-containing protein [Planctomycetaceae bacterium]|nr:PASTA domain-containing protein [Planctomycetaceae bacterium]